MNTLFHCAYLVDNQSCFASLTVSAIIVAAASVVFAAAQKDCK